jgi:hypothetical protein
MDAKGSLGILQPPGVSDIHVIGTRFKLPPVKEKLGGVPVKPYLPGTYGLFGPFRRGILRTEPDIRPFDYILSAYGDPPIGFCIQKNFCGANTEYLRPKSG